jgi:hypothetical protein
VNLFLILGGHIEPIFFFDCPRQAMESRKKKDHIPAASAAPSQGPSTGAGSQDPSIRAPPQDPTTLETLAYDADAEAASYGTPYILEKDPGLLLTVESAWKVDHLLRKGAAEMDDAALAKQLHDHAPGTCEAPFTEEKLHLASPTIEKSDAFAAFALQENMDERSFGPQDSEPADVFQHPGASPEGGHLGMAEEDGKVRDGKDVDMLEPQRKAEPAQVVEPVLAAEPDEAVQPVQVVVDESPAKVTEAEPAKVTAKVPEPGDEPKPLEHGAPHDMVAKEEVVSMLECMLSDGMDLKDAIAQVKGAPLVLRVEQFKNKSGQAAERPDDDVEPSQLPGQSGTPKAKAKAKANAKGKAKAKAKAKASTKSKAKAAAKRKSKASKATEEEADAIDLDEEDDQAEDDQVEDDQAEDDIPKEEPPKIEVPESVEVPKVEVQRKASKAKRDKEPKEDECKKVEPKPKKQRPEANSFARRPCPATSPAKDRWAAIVKTFKEEIRKPLMDMEEPISKWEEGWECE